ncbi:MAG TPA: STAS domain-containing protein [Mycobacteriales bacterium]|jgi:Anti-anti-sigma regulatory factor (antagonist of anti-sigma factor)
MTLPASPGSGPPDVPGAVPAPDLVRGGDRAAGNVGDVDDVKDIMDTRDQVRDRAVVRLTDATFRDGMAELRWRLRDQILAGVRVLVVDVSAVRQLSSTAVAVLLGAHRSCRARGGRVIIRNPNRRTLDLLHRTGLWRVLRPEFTEMTRSRDFSGPSGVGESGSVEAERAQRPGRRAEEPLR